MTDFEKATIQVIDLVNDQVRDFPYCKEDKVFSLDMNRMICVNPFSSAGIQGMSYGMTLWNTDTWRELGTSTIQTSEDYGTFNLAISPDGSRLIIEENSQISLWDIDALFHQE
jgi:WD40 repeat protein